MDELTQTDRPVLPDADLGRELLTMDADKRPFMAGQEAELLASASSFHQLPSGRPSTEPT